MWLHSGAMYRWTTNGTPFTIEFNKFFEDDELSIDFQKFAFNGKIKSLYPENLDLLTDEMKTNINDYFYYRQISEETPQKFLRHFHQTIRLGVDRWTKLLESMTLLKPDDGRFNYDLTEESSYKNELNRNGTTTSNGETSGTASQESTQNNTSTGKAKETSQNLSYESDTPENSVSDIEHYMSAAARAGSEGDRTDEASSESNVSGTSNQSSTSNSTSSMTSEEGGTGKSNLRRYGNIGVMTSAQILGGYRDAQAWSAWNTIFAELEPLFLQVF